MKYGRTLQVPSLVVLLASPGWAQLTQRVSVTTAGVGGNGHSFNPSISADGFSVAFLSDASNLIAWDTNGFKSAYFRAWPFNYNEIVDADTNSNLANDDCGPKAMSADGRIVVFASAATNLVPGDTNGQTDIFVRNRSAGTTQRASLSSVGAQANGFCYEPAISPDGRYVTFYSSATNLVPGDANNKTDVFLRDMQNGATELVSVSTTGVQGNSDSVYSSISADGRYVAFMSLASNLVPGDTNSTSDIFLRDRTSGTTQLVSVSTGGVPGNAPSTYPSISADGLSIAFVSDASNLIGWDTNGLRDVYFRAWAINYNELVSASSSSSLGNAAVTGPASISADGRFVVFASGATNLVPNDHNSRQDVFIRCRSIGTTEIVSISSSGSSGNFDSSAPSVSADGRFVAFMSRATNLVFGDTNNFDDIFIRDRYVTGFTSLCEPGVGGVRTCPCGNPPSGAGRGCNNSSATGGAYLTATGTAYLSTDSLVFTTFAEKPTALSILMQGNALVSAGAVYGQGVRCVGGSLKRLFTKSASGGSIAVPNFGGGDPSVSARSAAKGDTIQPGQDRWYFVYYRDPTVLGGCPAASTLNATQTGQVTWMP